ncbi:MAG: SprB repeat-containing protein, partial [Flavobacteriaceae bacterium]|nr:SprB repeat-containing protein [Flavobacteriaceae bacterium]
GSIKIRVQTLEGVQVEKISWFKNNQAYSAVFGEDAYEIKELEKGTYQVVVVDSEGCTTSSEAIEITEPLPLIIKDISLEMVNCFDDHTATATAVPQGGIPPYHYTWKNEQGIALTPSSKKIENLKAGRYALILRDASGSTAMAQQEFTITQPEKPLALATTNTLNNHCFGEENGSIEVGITGGTPPYQYHWSNGETTQKISNLKAGSYTLEVVDAKSCMLRQSFTIAQPDPLSLDKKLT